MVFFFFFFFIIILFNVFFDCLLLWLIIREEMKIKIHTHLHTVGSIRQYEKHRTITWNWAVRFSIKLNFYFLYSVYFCASTKYYIMDLSKKRWKFMCRIEQFLLSFFLFISFSGTSRWQYRVGILSTNFIFIYSETLFFFRFFFFF